MSQQYKNHQPRQQSERSWCTDFSRPTEVTKVIEHTMRRLKSVHQHFYRPSRSISVAAFRPQAPITPPPGWAALPQIYKPRTGVR
jgi:hypothetical protein